MAPPTDGAAPMHAMPDADTARLGFNMQRLYEDLGRHMDSDKEQLSRIDGKFGPIYEKLNRLDRFQAALTAIGSLLIILLGFLAYFAKSVISETVRQEMMPFSAKVDEVAGIKAEVRSVQQSVGNKASQESANNRDRRIEILEDRSHTHGRK